MVSQATIERIERALAKAVSDEVDQVPELMQALVAERMMDKQRPQWQRNEGRKLYEGTGTLKRAFIRGQRGSLYKPFVRSGIAEIPLGVDTREIPYARIHEFGGTITVPITPKMRRYFWYAYYQTLDDKYRFMALTKKTSFIITMPARPYFSPSIEELDRDELPAMLDRIYARVMMEFK